MKNGKNKKQFLNGFNFTKLFLTKDILFIKSTTFLNIFTFMHIIRQTTYHQPKNLYM